MFAIGGEIIVDVFVVEMDFAAGGLQEARKHFYCGAFSGTVGAEIAEDLAGLEGKGDVKDGGYGAIELAEGICSEHRVPFFADWADGYAFLWTPELGGKFQQGSTSKARGTQSKQPEMAAPLSW